MTSQPYRYGILDQTFSQPDWFLGHFFRGAFCGRCFVFWEKGSLATAGYSGGLWLGAAIKPCELSRPYSFWFADYFCPLDVVGWEEADFDRPSPRERE